MGVDSRRPLLPAPTESIVDTTGGSTTGTDLATDLSRRTDKTSYSIPDDGSPVTIPFRRKNRAKDSGNKDDPKLSQQARNSQTSLLIEYFEGGKESSPLVPRPSVRVRVTPSSANKSKDQRDRIQISEAGSSRKPSYSRRISLSSPSAKKKQLEESGAGDQSPSSSTSALDENTPSRKPPVEIEFVNREQGSELSAVSRDARFMQPTSDISSMPADSLLEAPSSGPRRKRSQSLERADENHGSKDLLKTPSRQRSRSLSKERIAHRVVEKLSNPQKEESTSKHRRSERSRRHSRDIEADPKSSKRRGNAHRAEEYTSPESSLLSNSAVSSRRRSGDQYSIRSGTSKSSINNPKLLETVEDAIRRLILPELKELKKDQKVMSNTSKFERDLSASYSSASTPSRDGLGRRLSKHASAPDVTKPKVVLNKDSKDEGIVLAGEPAPTKRERQTSRDSQSSEASYVKWGNRREMTEQDMVRRQKSKGLRDAAAAGIVGTALTSAALKHHDSRSSLEQTEDTRDGPPGGINETELVFQKHNVPALPLHSEINSELTRDSLLSQRTDETATQRGSKAQDVSQGSPMQAVSPTSRTPNRTPLDSRYGLGAHHSNLSSHNLSPHNADQDWEERSLSPLEGVPDGAIAAAAAANLLDVHSDRRDSDFNSRRRTLSPIQSVASDQSEAHIKRHFSHQDEHAPGGEREMEPRLSIDSLSSAPSTNLARSTRPDNNSLQSQSRDMKQQETFPDLGYEERPRSGVENWESSEAGDAYRQSLAESNRMTDDGNSDVHYTEKINEGQHVTDGTGANPQFVHPVGVESAVASLLDPSVLESSLSGNRSAPNLPEQVGDRSPKSMGMQQESYEPRHGSPLKQQQDIASLDATSFPRRMGATSPPQSVTQSIEDQDELGHMMPAGTRDIQSPLPEAGKSQGSESEINTNPSIIQGPIGDVSHENREHWAYDASSPKADQSPHYGNAATAAAAGLGAAAAVGAARHAGHSQDYYSGTADPYGARGYLDHEGDGYMGGELYTTPPAAKDEGYISAANPLSPSDTPQQGNKGLGGIDTNPLGLFDSPSGGDDPFTTSHQRHLSGYSNGVGSPLYDSATGKGIERIQSQDIVALMDHLTVRDAQRNARDTEILVTLVRSAAEMRNSFEEMKKFIAQQDGLLMEAGEKQHDRMHKVIGARPMPGPRTRQLPDDGEDMRSKRENVFKRALKGLSLKSSNDLTKVEEMLEQLLEEVDGLRYGQDGAPLRSGPRASMDRNGYETEGRMSLSRDGYPPSSPQAGYNVRNGQRHSEDRASTIRGMDNEIDPNERGEFLSPRPSRENPRNRHERGGSAPLEGTPRVPVASGARSNEASPNMNGKGRKQKSSSTSFFPKISRWSKATSDNIRNSMQPGRKDRPYMDPSRSGSDLYNPHDFYDPQGEDRIRSNHALNEQHENRPPSPLVPSQVSEAPKYQAHRNSLNLQHPQPRQGPSGRYQSQLETSAQDYYGSPISPNSDPWGSNPSLSGANPAQQRFSGHRLSPISDAGYSETSSRFERQSGPPRPPKVKDDGPLIPDRSSIVSEEERPYTGRVTSRSSAMRASPHNSPPVRKPTGPRPLTSGQYCPDKIKRTRYRGSPNQIDDEMDY